MTKWIDLPPVWLCLFLVLTWLQATRLPFGGDLGAGALGDLIGGLLVGGGLVLMVLAFVEMRRAKTTVIPHMTPHALVTTGIFRRTRNPIYLGDALILTGLAFRWDAWPSLVLVPLFVWVITDRFILSEEARLQEQFGASFERYTEETRRWV
ncbi:methyltransferase family protein [Meridianimarinicoccus aquatilis]|uniref:Isoprenylcysteine carboxylmethyltransferase family protein n=1 Tax=Meridianimarinicoccus aquatilis TaxID=2552766 RepID=A0A4R6AUE3_9RHOB|nr:isoprenylcysteine carboxylmethyltransferase family protein [Fluviibacterium aquatile]QIE42184.1 isoprenylcysteine carboxylmethyltransferase family protein [Rhodobacteraceae bacterium SC52]TDL85836.1 isoprenylcysteine carboxylmethyltransferase family protein [Fluviibacterium aquatile]